MSDRITGWMVQQRDKHDLGATYVEDQINDLTPYELLVKISDALEEEKAERAGLV